MSAHMSQSVVNFCPTERKFIIPPIDSYESDMQENGKIITEILVGLQQRNFIVPDVHVQLSMGAGGRCLKTLVQFIASIYYSGMEFAFDKFIALEGEERKCNYGFREITYGKYSSDKVQNNDVMQFLMQLHSHIMKTPLANVCNPIQFITWKCFDGYYFVTIFCFKSKYFNNIIWIFYRKH